MSADRPTPLCEALDIKLAEKTDTKSPDEMLYAYHEMLNFARQLEQMCAELAAEMTVMRWSNGEMPKSLAKYEAMKGKESK